MAIGGQACGRLSVCRVRAGEGVCGECGCMCDNLLMHLRLLPAQGRPPESSRAENLAMPASKRRRGGDAGRVH